MKLNLKNNGQKTKLVVITALVSFSVVFMLTGLLMTSVYGAETLGLITTTAAPAAEASIGAGLSVPINTSVNNLELVNDYVEKVKQDICPTLNNQTQVEECWKL